MPRPTREHRLVGRRIVKTPIAQIEPCDRVLTRDQNDPHGSIFPAEVVETYQPIADHLRLLTLAMPYGSEMELETTDNHPFHVPGPPDAAGARRANSASPTRSAPPATPWPTSKRTSREEHPEGVEVCNFQARRSPHPLRQRGKLDRRPGVGRGYAELVVQKCNGAKE